MKSRRRVLIVSSCLLILGYGIYLGMGGWLWGTDRGESPQPNLSSQAPVERERPRAQAGLPQTLYPVSSTQRALSALSEADQTQRKLNILHEVFRTKNDNDPRLDSEFNHLTALEKKALERDYEGLPAEARNERGTIVYLIGRNLSSPEDFDFLKKVIAEPACLSLSDCQHAAPRQTGMGAGAVSVEEGASGQGVTLEYPKLVALKFVERWLQDPIYSVKAREVLKEALDASSPIVRQQASSMVSLNRQLI